jgi:hypothetical protein
VSVLLLAQSTSDNSPAGQNFTLWFPAGLFIIVGVILYLMYSRPHQRVPPRRPAHAQASPAHAQASGAAPAASASAKEEAAEPGDAGAEATE